MPSWTLREVAEVRRCHISTVRMWAQTNDWPLPNGKVSNAYTYDADEVRAWLDQHDLRDNQWTMRMIATELNIADSLILGARKHGRFPPPDGRRGVQPWWRSATVRAWWTGRHVPAGAWTLEQVAEHCGLTTWSLPQSRLPIPDGVAVTIRWWHPPTIRDWWAPQAAQKLDRARRRTAAEEARIQALDPDVWFGQEVAIHTGLSYESVRTYRKLGKMPYTRRNNRQPTLVEARHNPGVGSESVDWTAPPAPTLRHLCSHRCPPSLTSCFHSTWSRQTALAAVDPALWLLPVERFLSRGSKPVQRLCTGPTQAIGAADPHCLPRVLDLPTGLMVSIAVHCGMTPSQCG